MVAFLRIFSTSQFLNFFSLRFFAPFAAKSSMNRYSAFLAYLFSVVGAIVVLFLRRDDRFAVYHAKQSLGLIVLAVVLFVAWGIVGWVISWIPFIGFILAMAAFALVIAGYITLTISWIVGMRYALNGQMQPVPMVGGLIQRFLP
jgi:uncharacterized membrane protein